MALDPVPTYPSQYDANEANNNPPGSDSRREGDDQIRRFKASYNQTFPNVSGPVTSTHEQLNALNDYVAASGTVEARIANLELDLPAGSRIGFYMASVPSAGWAQVTSADVDGAMIRIVNTAGGGNGGSDNPILNDKVAVHTHTASSGNAGGHDHPAREFAQSSGGTLTYTFEQSAINGPDAGNNALAFDRIGPVGPVSDHTHPVTVDNNAGGANWEPKYMDWIVGERQ